MATDKAAGKSPSQKRHRAAVDRSPKVFGLGRPSNTSTLTLARDHVLQVLQSHKHDPFNELVRLARDPDTPRELAYQCNRELASYLAPKYRPVDGSAAGATFAFNINVTATSARPAGGVIDVTPAKPSA